MNVYSRLAPKVRRAVRVIARLKTELAKRDVHPESPEGIAITRRAVQAARVIDRNVGGPQRRTELLARLRSEGVIPSAMSDTVKDVELCERCFGTLRMNGTVTLWKGTRGADGETEHTIERVICEECDFRERVAEYEKTGELTRWLVQECSMIGWWLDKRSAGYRKEFTRRALRFADVARRVNADVDRIHAAVKRFEKDAWFGGLQKFITDEKDYSGHSGEADGVKMLTMCSAARWMATISDEKTGDNVTVITEEKSPKPRMGMQSVAATAENAVRLLDFAREHWRDLSLKPDAAVSIA
jgi:hypothetical protein